MHYFKPRRIAPHEQAIHRLLRPIIRFALRRSVRIQDFIDIAKGVFVEVAAGEMVDAKANSSRLSLATGLTRKDVSAFFREDIRIPETQSVLTRVIGQWEHDPEFSQRGSKAKILQFPQFTRLVSKVSKHVGPKAVLLELERNGVIEQTPRGIKLLRSVVDFTVDELQAFDLISRDISDLIDTLQHNLQHGMEAQNAHFRTEYTAILSSMVPAARKRLLTMTRAFHAEVREYLAKLDLDINPSMIKSSTKQVRVMLSSFAFIEENPSPQEES